jgi:hypothetical protein
MTNEKGLFAQADLGIASRSTTERKKMSTKTSFKRIALVAAASLGLGVLTSVSANAAGGAAVFTVIGTNATTTGATTAPIPAGTPATFNIELTSTAGTTIVAEQVGAKFTVTAGPDSKDITSTCTFTPVAVANGAGAGGDGTITTTVVNAATGDLKLVIGAVSAAGGVTAATVATLSCPTTIGGTYTVTTTAGTTVASGLSFGTPTAPATEADGLVVVSGLNITQGSSRSTTTGSAAVNGYATVLFTAPKHTGVATSYTIKSSGTGSIYGVGSIVGGGSTKAVNGSTTDYATGVVLTTAASTALASVPVTLTSAVAGTQTITASTVDATSGSVTELYTATITWGDSSSASASQSSVVIEKSSNDTSVATSDSSSILLSKTTLSGLTVGDDEASIWVTLKDQFGNALNGQKISVSLDGPGLIAVDQDQNGVTGAMTRRTYSDTTANAGNTWQIGIAPDGTAGKLNVTVSVGTSVLAVKSLTWYGGISKIVATPVLIATADGTATAEAVVACATDSVGTTIPSAAIYATSGDTSVATVAVSGTGATSAQTDNFLNGVAATDTTYSQANFTAAKNIGCAGFAVTGANQTVKDSVVLTFRDAATVADSSVSTTATVKVGGVKAYAVVLSSNKASYTAGSKGTISLTFKDSVGRLVGANPGTGTLAAVLTSSASLQGAALFATANNILNGVVTADVYFPYYAGTLTIVGTTGQNSTYLDSSVRGLELTKSIAITAPADSTSAQIASLISKINALSKLIAKIQKKLGIK